MGKAARAVGKPRHPEGAQHSHPLPEVQVGTQPCPAPSCAQRTSLPLVTIFPTPGQMTNRTPGNKPTPQPMASCSLHISRQPGSPASASCSELRAQNPRWAQSPRAPAPGLTPGQDSSPFRAGRHGQGSGPGIPTQTCKTPSVGVCSAGQRGHLTEGRRATRTTADFFFESVSQRSLDTV